MQVNNPPSFHDAPAAPAPIIFIFRSTINLSSAEASCASAVRVARNVVRDFGREAARRTGLEQLSRCNVNSAEKETNRLLCKRYKLSLPICMSHLPSEDTGKGPPCLKMRHWLSFLLRKRCFHILVGLQKPDEPREEAILHGFWEEFRKTCQDHPVFGLERAGQLVLSRTVPLLWHGDEGRGRRRSPFLVTSYHSVLGKGIRPGVAKSQHKPKPYIRLKPNFLGHSYTHRFLHTAMPKKLYEEPEVFASILADFAEEAVHLHTAGVEHPRTKVRYHACILGITGDWAFLHKAGGLKRSYNNVVKGPQEIANPVGICHLCLAGRRGYDFEEIQSRNPSWLSTFCTETPFQGPSPLRRLLHCPDREACLYRFDLWHSYHLGVGKSFVASGVAVYSEFLGGRSKDARLEKVEAEFFDWCKANGHAPILTRLSKDTISWDTNNSFPIGSWYKGGITTAMSLFLQDTLAALEHPDPTLQLVKEAAEAINGCIAGLYSEDVFMPASRAHELGELGLRFLRRYQTLAKQAVEASRTFWILLPKHHALHHLFLQDLVLASQSSPTVLNPVCFSVQMSEDFIGRNSRTSRRVHPSLCSQRVIERHLQLAYREYVKQGYLVEERD